MQKKNDMDNLIEIQNLTLIKESNYILKNINFKIKSSGITFIIGPNGAGKTQFLRCLHGLEQIKGLIKFNNEELCERVIEKQSFVFQQPILLKRTVLENLIFFAKNRNVKNYFEKSINLLKLLKLDKLKNNSASTLSGGEKQRLSVGRALSTNPNLLFLDEPTAHLDPFSIKIIEQILKKICIKGTKVIFISHDLNQVKRLADDVIFMHKGEIKEYNLVNELFKRQQNKITELFLKGNLIV